MKHILYVRSGPYQIDLNAYNSQEIGLADAFAEKGVSLDIVFYHKHTSFDQTIEKNGHSINILWRKGIKLFRSGIYPQVLKKAFLTRYDAVIISEYSQVMAVLLNMLHGNVYIYNGIYYNLFKLRFLESVYDCLFCKYLNKKTKAIFCKTLAAKEYLETKGFTNCKVICVGLDYDKFNQENNIEEKTRELLNIMVNHRNILFVGNINKRKNTDFLIQAFNNIKEKQSNQDVQLILIGKDENGYLERCNYLINENFKESVIYRKFIKNAQLKFIYEKADIFVLPSVHEIFGMVLLEAMYFGVAVLASGSAGARTLIDDGINGRIIDDFDEKQWRKVIQELIDNEHLRRKLGKEASIKIKKEFMWSNVADRIWQEIV